MNYGAKYQTTASSTVHQKGRRKEIFCFSMHFTKSSRNNSTEGALSKDDDKFQFLDIRNMGTQSFKEIFTSLTLVPYVHRELIIHRGQQECPVWLLQGRTGHFPFGHSSGRKNLRLD